jgi:hypothetical protein
VSKTLPDLFRASSFLRDEKMKKVYADSAFRKIEFVPTEAMAKRIGSPAFAFVSQADVEKFGLEVGFTAVTGRPASSILKVDEVLVDATGDRVEVIRPFSASVS